jgi:hypothetical protein
MTKAWFKISLGCIEGLVDIGHLLITQGHIQLCTRLFDTLLYEPIVDWEGRCKSKGHSYLHHPIIY